MRFNIRKSLAEQCREVYIEKHTGNAKEIYFKIIEIIKSEAEYGSCFYNWDYNERNYINFNCIRKRVKEWLIEDGFDIDDEFADFFIITWR